MYGRLSGCRPGVELLADARAGSVCAKTSASTPPNKAASPSGSAANPSSSSVGAILRKGRFGNTTSGSSPSGGGRSRCGGGGWTSSMAS